MLPTQSIAGSTITASRRASTTWSRLPRCSMSMKSMTITPPILRKASWIGISRAAARLTPSAVSRDAAALPAPPAGIAAVDVDRGQGAHRLDQQMAAARKRHLLLQRRAIFFVGRGVVQFPTAARRVLRPSSSDRAPRR